MTMEARLKYLLTASTTSSSLTFNLLHIMKTFKQIKVSSILTDEVLRQRDKLLAQGFKHVNNIDVRGDCYTMLFCKYN